MTYYGDYLSGATVTMYFNTFDSNDPSASVTMTNFVNTDVHIHRGSDLTQRNNAAGVTVDVDVDTIAGGHLIEIDTSDNTVAGFFRPGYDYGVRIEGTTVDAATINAFVGSFSIENRAAAGVLARSRVATYSSQTSFTLTSGEASADNDAYNGCLCIITDEASLIQKQVGYITDYVGATRTVTLAADPGVFTFDADDHVTILAGANVAAWNGVLLATTNPLPNAAADAAGGLPISDAGGLDLDGRLDAAVSSRLAPTVAARTLDITATGAAGIDWGNVENPTTAVDLSATDIQLCDTVTTNTDMRGTDSAALASVVGALTDVAAAGDPTTADTLMQYVKQLINVLVGTTGVTTFPAEAAPANNVSLAEVVRAIHADVTGLNGDAMRGTDSAALASVATEARLAELDAANLPTDIAGVQSDTDDLQTRTPAALVGGRMDSNVGAISGDATAADRLEALMDGTLICQVNDAAATTTAFAADGFTEATDDHFIGRLITFISGALTGQQTAITDYDAAGHAQGAQTFIVDALTEAPANNDFFVVH